MTLHSSRPPCLLLLLLLLLSLPFIQILKTGFFHADPHPGNLAVLSDNSIIYYDFGMMGEIPAFTKDRLMSIFYAVYEKDAKKVRDVDVAGSNLQLILLDTVGHCLIPTDFVEHHQAPFGGFLIPQLVCCSSVLPIPVPTLPSIPHSHPFPQSPSLCLNPFLLLALAPLSLFRRSSMPS